MINVGDLVRCVDSNFTIKLTLGEEYEVVKVIGDMVRVIADDGLKRLYSADRFKIVSHGNKPAPQVNPKRHIHADLIHAWAEGAEIEFFGFDQKWLNVKNPSFNAADKYRIKPQVIEINGKKYDAEKVAKFLAEIGEVE